MRKIIVLLLVFLSSIVIIQAQTIKNQHGKVLAVNEVTQVFTADPTSRDYIFRYGFTVEFNITYGVSLGSNKTSYLIRVNTIKPLLEKGYFHMKTSKIPERYYPCAELNGACDNLKLSGATFVPIWEYEGKEIKGGAVQLKSQNGDFLTGYPTSFNIPKEGKATFKRLEFVKWSFNNDQTISDLLNKRAQDYPTGGNQTEADKKAEANTGSGSAKEEVSSDDFWSDTGGGAQDTGGSTQGTGHSDRTGAGSDELSEQAAPETMSDDEVRQLVKDNIEADMQEQQALEDRVTAKVDNLFESFYQAQVAGASLNNMQSLSKLSGTYSSVEELEREFSQQYYMISQEADNYVQAKTAAASTYINSTTNTAQEAAYGEGLKVVSGIIAQAQAAKAEKEAREELQRQREVKLKAMQAAQLKAIVNARIALLKAFPSGGTPLSSHKVNLPEVYIFAYVADKALLSTGKPANVSVSNVIPVHRYADGTYPYRTTILTMLRGYAPGEMTIVGYYTQIEMAEKMRTAFLNFAGKSKLTVSQFHVQDKRPSGSQTNAGDFWENGSEIKPSSDEKKPEDNSGFWDN